MKLPRDKWLGWITIGYALLFVGSALTDWASFTYSCWGMLNVSFWFWWLRYRSPGRAAATIITNSSNVVLTMLVDGRPHDLKPGDVINIVH